MKWNRFLSAAVILGAMACTASANAITGSFVVNGIMTVTATTISWQSDLSPNFADRFTLSLGTGSFSTENGQNTIDNLTLATEPVGASFAATPFVSFNVVGGLPVLDINYIFAGFGGSIGCTQPPAIGQTCTPPNPGGSPFTFSNAPGNPPPAIQSSAAFYLSGVTSDGLSSWEGSFESSFNEPFQQVLAAFGPNGLGTVTQQFSGTIYVTANPTPEPAPYIMFGLGLIGIAMLRKVRWARN